MRFLELVRAVALTAVALLVAPSEARAQDPVPEPSPPTAIGDTTSAATRFARRFAGQLSVVQMRPVGELAQNIGFGYGLEGAALMRLDAAGVLALRAELGFVQYGSEHMTVPLSSTVGSRILVNVTTTNDVITSGLGAQVMLPSGVIRPYATGSAGLVSFITQSSVEGSGDAQPFAQTTNHQDTGFAWLAGGGLYIPLSRGAHRVSVDVGATYHATQGKRSYLKPGSIHDLPGGGIAIDPLYSQANFLTWRVGLRFGP